MKKSMRFRSGRSVLVTGAGGFIGSHLCDALLALGHRVTGIDCFTDYYRIALKARNLALAAQNPNFRLVEADVVEADLLQLMDGVEVIYHLAGQPGVRGSWGEQFEVYTRNNILATQRLLEANLAKGRVPVVYASSSSAYGNQKVMPLDEAVAPAPQSPYGVTKLGAEHLCRLYSQVHGLPTVSLRLFTVYGPRQRPDMAFHRFLSAVAAGDEITVYGDGRQTRDFTFVEDVVAAFIAAGEVCAAGQMVAPVMNVAGGSRASMLDVLAAVTALTPHKIRVRHQPPQPGDVQDTWADTKLATHMLGFKPRTELREGLERQWHAVRRGDAPELRSFAVLPDRVALQHSAAAAV
jgi:UDP-glucuronate 4-epimerase